MYVYSLYIVEQNKCSDIVNMSALTAKVPN